MDCSANLAAMLTGSAGQYFAAGAKVQIRVSVDGTGSPYVYSGAPGWLPTLTVERLTSA